VKLYSVPFSGPVISRIYRGELVKLEYVPF